MLTAALFVLWCLLFASAIIAALYWKRSGSQKARSACYVLWGLWGLVDIVGLVLAFALGWFG